MVLATRKQLFTSFLVGFEVSLIPQTILYFDVLGPIPLMATLGLVPALIGLTDAVRRQTRLLIQTQLEKQRLADELTQALAVAEYLANRDSLTGLFNRRAFEEAASRIRKDAEAMPISLILIDLDHFKSINDEYGHSTGDSVLIKTAQLIEDAIATPDLAGRLDGALSRWGGEEFILLLRDCSAEKAAEIAEIIRVNLAQTRCPDWPQNLTVTGSFGIAEWLAGTPLHLAISKADEAMYCAKKDGRNRTCVHHQDKQRSLSAVI
jgi:diguanylate cyclase (GGDEF)-like protein